MRMFLIAALLAGVAAPALAARPNDENGERHHERSERSESRESSSSKQDRSADRPQRSVDRPAGSSGASGGESHPNSTGRMRAIDSAGSPAVAQVHRGDGGSEVRLNRQHEQAVRTEVEAPAAPHRDFEPKEVRAPHKSSEAIPSGQGDSVRNWRSRERQSDASPTSIEEHNMRRAPTHEVAGELVQPKHPGPRVIEQGERRISRTPIRGTEPPAPRTASSRNALAARHWNTNWRHDHRYDWHNWRKHHHSHFHLGFYYDPFGWDYFRYGIGWRLWPSYYRNSFWLNDPWQYRLPPAYGPYRWIRYFNDALLVNIYTGEVVDVEYNFFW